MNSSKIRDVFKVPTIVAFRRDKNQCDTLIYDKTNGAMRSTANSCKTDRESVVYYTG